MDIWKINFLKLITMVCECILKNCKRAIQKVRKKPGKPHDISEKAQLYKKKEINSTLKDALETEN